MDGLAYGSGVLSNVPVSIGGTSSTEPYRLLTPEFPKGNSLWKPEIPQEGVIVEKLDEIAAMPDRRDAALEMFCFIARAQMFIDGNKRVAQLMCNKIMMNEDIGILSIPYDEIGTFMDLLVDCYESGNNAKLKAFFREKCLLLNPDCRPKMSGRQE